MGLPGRLLAEGEHVVVTTRSHGKALTGPVLVLLATAFVATFAAGRVGRELTGAAGAAALLVVAVVAALLLLRRVLAPFLRWLGTTYTVTDRRLVVRAGVLAREGRSVPLDRVTGLDVRIGLLDRLLGCGTLVVTEGEDGRLELHDLPRVEEVEASVADQLHHVHALRRSRSSVLVGHEVGEGGGGDGRLDDR